MGKPKAKSYPKSSGRDGDQMIRVPTGILRHCSEYTLRILLTGGKSGKAKACTSIAGRSNGNDKNACQGPRGSGGRAHWDDSFEGSDAESFLNMLIPETKLTEEGPKSDLSIEQHFDGVKLENLPPPPSSCGKESESEEEESNVILPPPPEFDSDPKMPKLELQSASSEGDSQSFCSEPSGPPELQLGHNQWDMGMAKKGWFEFECNLCDKTYDALWKLKKHEKYKHGTLMKPYQCSACDKSYANEWSMKRHVKKSHKGKTSYTNGDAQIEPGHSDPVGCQESTFRSSGYENRKAEEDHFKEIVVAYEVMEYLMDCVELLELYGGGEAGEQTEDKTDEKSSSSTRSEAIIEGENTTVQTDSNGISPQVPGKRSLETI